ncbi:hypothetical protein D0863_08211 [Hortaea werneckii]|uniref:Endo-1,5-alpha-L-arabinanase A n=1 Tax=Hortaea werneckii TaxID=91943 RepID=A0A3M7DR18_HORWE|nr:hypothetical protein D0863_08211 [Hortaea werneckii]
MQINIKGKCDLWAPDVIKVDGKYYMYYSVSSMGSKTSDIGVATSPNMECGTWTDHGSIGIPTGSWNRIDANMLSISPKSTGYMLWGSFWTGIWQARMAIPPLRVVDNVKTVHLEQNTPKRPDNRPTGPSEGGFNSDGGSGIRTEYKVMVCRSDRPEGPFVDKRERNCATKNGGTLVYWGQGNTFAAGGQGVMYDGGLNKVVMYYHYIDKKVGYAYEKFKFGWNVLRFGNDGWPVVVPWDQNILAKMSEIQGLREQILANTKYLPNPDPPRPTKQKASPAYELLIARNTPPTGISISETLRPSTTTTTTTTSTTTAADVPSYKALLLTPPNEGAHIRIEGPDVQTVEGALQAMLEVTARMVEQEMKKRGGEVIKREEILDSREELGDGVLVVMRVPDEEMEMEMGGGGDGEGDGGTAEKVEGDGEGDGGTGKVEGRRGPGRPKKAEGGGAVASAAGAGAGGAAVDGEGRVVKRGRGRPKKNAG